MAGVAPLLEKLEPMAMMEEGGLQRASIAIKLLAHKSATDPSVGGGILVVAPGEGTVAVWSPGLNEAGTSKVGALALEALVERTGWSVFG